MSQPNSHAWKSWLKTGFKIALVLGLFYYLAQKGLLSMQATASAFSDGRHMSIALVCMLVATFLGSVRWQWLLRAQSLNLPFARVIELAFVGNFFNIALPGAVTGDVMKAVYIGKEVQGQKAMAFGSILFDRLAGLSALLLVSVIALLMDFNALLGSGILSALKLFLLTAAGGVVFGYGYLFLVTEKHDPLLGILKSFEKKFARLQSVTQVYLGLRHYHHHRAVVVKTLVISIIIHLLICTAYTCFLAALGDTLADPIPLFFVTPLGLLVTAVPVAPAGVGTGNAAFSYLYHFLGSARGADAYSLFAIFQVLIGSIGGIVYLRFKSTLPAINTTARI